MARPLTTSRFQEEMLRIMDCKHHWAWPVFSDGTAAKEQMKQHFRQEFAVYVRDFPVFLARIHGHNPPPTVRRMLAENIYEEDTGGLSLGKSHPELFLQMMAALGFGGATFEDVRLLPGARRYRAWLERASNHRDWVVGAAVITVFVEGSIKDRKELAEPSKPRTSDEIELIVQQHPLVKYYGLPTDAMDLIRAHQMVEAGHRHDAYHMVVNHAKTRAQQDTVLRHLNRSLTLWTAYRDEVARACGIRKR
ncbi:MAG TPA: iron-containing redox enzyme family protein [Nitrospira sp.]|jgi:pyrroloquinoline quinone (PQQ) biosynthesis protein C|nr:iron-containing redox enzyme family protein [Nitrospira sp.]